MEPLVLDVDIAGVRAPVRSIAKVGRRLVASLLDGLVLIPLIAANMALSYTVSVPYATMPIAIIAMAYKPTMEYLYGATLGKRWMHMRVVDSAFAQPTLYAILLRNIFSIGLNGLLLLLTLAIAYAPGQMDTLFGTPLYATQKFLPYGRTAIVVVDFIFLLADTTLRRALHDRIAGTLVVHDGALPQSAVSSDLPPGHGNNS